MEYSEALKRFGNFYKDRYKIEFLTLLEIGMTKCIGVSIPMLTEVKVGYKLGSLKEWVRESNIWHEKCS